MSRPMTSDLEPDATVGSYRLVRQIGRGGMATVFEARHTVLPRRAAIKVMHAELRHQPGMATRVVQEAAIIEDIRHPGIVRVYECNLLPDHRPWIAMELVQGETLATRMAQSTLPASEVAKLLVGVAEVLAATHARGVIHRDLKPDNLILTPTDRDYPLRLIDWGVARLGPFGRITLDGTTPGTPIYMSPEQAAGRDISGPCDVYSLGVIAYEALSGHPPFDGRTLAEVVAMHLTRQPDSLHDKTCAPRGLCDLVHAMLKKDPAARPSAIEVRRRAAQLTASDYEHYELAPSSARSAVTDETVVVDPEVLEFGVTELLPTIPRPRWTPGTTYVLPRCDQVSGEFIAKRR